MDLRKLISVADETRIVGAFSKCGFNDLTKVRETLGDKYDFGILRLCRTVQLQKMDARHRK